MAPVNPNKATEDRRISRMQQMEMMEAAARGTAPSIQLDTTGVSPPASGLRSRNASHGGSSSEARRFLSEDDDYGHNGSMSIGPVGRTTAGGTLFHERELYSVDQSINLMDPATESYTPTVTSNKTMASFIDIFLGGSGSTSGQGSSRRSSVSTTWQSSLGGRLFVLCVFVSFGVILAMSVTYLTQDPSENDRGIVKTGNRYEDIKSVLLLNSASHTEYLTDKSTSAYHALRWLSETDPAQLEPDDNELLARFALASFYYATHSDAAEDHSSGKVKVIDSGWKRDDNWMSKESVCNWYGVDCEAVGTRSRMEVVHFNLTLNAVKGNIPLELRSLSNMVVLDLSYNHLSGTIPVPLYRMFQITYLLLHNNKLEGSIPEYIGMMEGAYNIYLSTNMLTGKIPTSIKKLSNLQALYLDNNMLTGSIPDLNGLKELNRLRLTQNQLTGNLPMSMMKLSNLNDLRVNENKLSGTIPPEIGNLKKLQVLYMGMNSFTGSVPDMFNGLKSLYDLQLHSNILQGTLPTTIQYLTDLIRLTIDTNGLSGSLPPEWSALTLLEAMGLHHNHIVGPIPTEYGQLTTLRNLYLNHNFLLKALPSELGRLTGLKDLYLEHNAFQGTLPTEFGALTSLAKFQIFQNQLLTGSMPSQICALKDLMLTELEADCNGKFECSCCTQCH